MTPFLTPLAPDDHGRPLPAHMRANGRICPFRFGVFCFAFFSVALLSVGVANPTRQLTPNRNSLTRDSSTRREGSFTRTRNYLVLVDGEKSDGRSRWDSPSLIGRTTPGNSANEKPSFRTPVESLQRKSMMNSQKHDVDDDETNNNNNNDNALKGFYSRRTNRFSEKRFKTTRSAGSPTWPKLARMDNSARMDLSAGIGAEGTPGDAGREGASGRGVDHEKFDTGTLGATGNGAGVTSGVGRREDRRFVNDEADRSERGVAHGGFLAPVAPSFQIASLAQRKKINQRGDKSYQWKRVSDFPGTKTRIGGLASEDNGVHEKFDTHEKGTNREAEFSNWGKENSSPVIISFGEADKICHSNVQRIEVELRGIRSSLWRQRRDLTSLRAAVDDHFRPNSSQIHDNILRQTSAISDAFQLLLLQEKKAKARGGKLRIISGQDGIKIKTWNSDSRLRREFPPRPQSPSRDTTKTKWHRDMADVLLMDDSDISVSSSSSSSLDKNEDSLRCSRCHLTKMAREFSLQMDEVDDERLRLQIDLLESARQNSIFRAKAVEADAKVVRMRNKLARFKVLTEALMETVGGIDDDGDDVHPEVPKMKTLKNDCAHGYDWTKGRPEGLYRIFISSSESFTAACDDDWLLIQRRRDADVDFDRDWNSYAEGFGNLTGDFWLGNRVISSITNSGKYKLRVELETLETGSRFRADYGKFYVASEQSLFRLTLGEFHGNMSDPLQTLLANFTHSGRQFTTHDRDNDLFKDGNCASKFRSGWWFADCFRSNFNGVFPRGVGGAGGGVGGGTRCPGDNCMKTFALDEGTTLKSVVMKIKPNPDFAAEEKRRRG